MGPRREVPGGAPESLTEYASWAAALDDSSEEEPPGEHPVDSPGRFLRRGASPGRPGGRIHGEPSGEGTGGDARWSRDRDHGSGEPGSRSCSGEQMALPA